MDILSRLEDLDSRAEKAKQGLGRWFLTIGIVSVVGVSATWAWRSWRESKNERKWQTFRTHIGARRGTLRINTEESVAKAEVALATGGCWGDLASALRHANGLDPYAFDPEAAVQALSAISSRGKPFSTARGGLFFLAEDGADGLTALSSRLSRTRDWLRSHPSLNQNVASDGFMKCMLETDAGQVEIALDSSISPDVLGDFEKAAVAGLMAGSSLNFDSTLRVFDLAPSDDARAKVPNLADILSNLFKAETTLSTFKGSVAIRSLPNSSGSHAICVLTQDALAQWRQLRPIGVVTKGSELLSLGPGNTPAKSSIKIAFAAVAPK